MTDGEPRDVQLSQRELAEIMEHRTQGTASLRFLAARVHEVFGLDFDWMGRTPTFTCEPVDDGGWLRRSCLVKVYGALLLHSVLPSGPRFAWFAAGPSGLRSFEGRPAALTQLLRDEGRPLDDLEPRMLANWCCRSVAAEWNHFHRVLEDAAAIFSMEDDYEVSEAEWRKVHAKIVPMSLTGDAHRGWTLEFTSLYGWEHECNQLLRHRHVVDPDYGVTLQTTLLSERLFQAVPSLIY